MVKKKGKEVFNARQEKWLKNYKRTNYSKVSQDLFWELYELIKDKFKEIRFATLDPVTKLKCTENRNHELSIPLDISFVKADFIITDLNLIIEFDGDYWHGESRGNQERDKIRDEKLRKLGYKLYHVRERDWKTNPQKVIKECVIFMRDVKRGLV